MAVCEATLNHLGIAYLILYLMRCTLFKHQAYLDDSEGDSHCPDHNQVVLHKGSHTSTTVTVEYGLGHDIIGDEAVWQSDICTVTRVWEQPCLVDIGRVQPVLIGDIATAAKLCRKQERSLHNKCVDKH